MRFACRLGRDARSQVGSHEINGHNCGIVPRYTRTNGAHAFEQAGGGSGAWYAMELTELLPHVARGLNINWDEAIRYAGLTSEL
jgi:hypothetical protein